MPNVSVSVGVSVGTTPAPAGASQPQKTQQSQAATAPATAKAPQAAKTTDVYARYLAPASVCPGQDATTAPLTVELKTMRCLLNYVRVKRGLHKLADSPLLDRSSTIKSQAIVKCNQFSHTPCGHAFTQTFSQVGYMRNASWWSVGENIAWATGDLASPKATMDAWLNSPEHRANLFTSSWRQTGLAVVRKPSLFGYSAVTLWTNEFGVRR